MSRLPVVGTGIRHFALDRFPFRQDGGEAAVRFLTAPDRALDALDEQALRWRRPPTPRSRRSGPFSRCC